MRSPFLSEVASRGAALRNYHALALSWKAYAEDVQLFRTVEQIFHVEALQYHDDVSDAIRGVWRQ